MVGLVAVYCDDGVSDVGVLSLKKAIVEHLKAEVVYLDAQQIIAGELAKCVALIIPGGADLPYCRKLNGEGNLQIRHFVEAGGLYVGICAGAYYACREIDFIGADYTVAGERELAFFDGLAKGSLPQWTNNCYFDESVASKQPVNVYLTENMFTKKREAFPFYYHGGPTFLKSKNTNYQVIGNYPDGSPAVILGKIGQGYYLLSGVHFELQAESYQQLVVNKATKKEQTQEQAICALFTAEYGKPIWQIIQQLLTR